MLFFDIDIETTGLKPKIHGVTEFACVFGDTNNPDLCKKFYRWLNPEGYVWSNYCLRLHAKWIDNVTFRLLKGHTEKLSENQPKIVANLSQLFYDFYDWLMAIGQCADNKPRILPTGKNFGSFDKNFLEQDSNWQEIFRHRTLDWVPFYQAKDDKVPPELELCKKRAIEAGCKRFENASVLHNALDDAMDVFHLIQFAYNEADIDKLRDANDRVSQVAR